jgi:hypothetical protein
MGTDEEGVVSEEKDRKPYSKPQIIREMELETRAGSPLPQGPIDPLNPASP